MFQAKVPYDTRYSRINPRSPEKLSNGPRSSLIINAGGERIAPKEKQKPHFRVAKHIEEQRSKAARSQSEYIGFCSTLANRRNGQRRMWAWAVLGNWVGLRIGIRGMEMGGKAVLAIWLFSRCLFLLLFETENTLSQRKCRQRLMQQGMRLQWQTEPALD